MFVKRAILWLLSLSLLLAVPVRAAEAEAVHCFSASDFSSGEEGLLGICVTELSGAACGLYCQGRPVAAGDVLTAAQLDQLTAAGRDPFTAEASLSFLPVFTDGIGAQETVVITLRGTENQPPETAAYRVETYKNVAVTEPFRCSDADGDAIAFRIVRQPRRGSVTVHADGTFTYTPNPEKVGNDHFTFIAADSRGAESPETRMDIRINKVSSGVFADMTGDPNEREALFLRTNGLLSGEYVAMTLCFRPEQPVSREEFLMMTMKLTGLEPESADDTDWFSPWQTAALRAGLPGLSTASLTKQTAAAWVSALTETEDSSVAVWSNEESDALLTRRDAAVLLYRLHVLHEEGLSFPWEAE
ncbi:MAG: cadherin-like domain-containing protein [Oscillospiraceae bacterium]|nr:cadherin-like domain-containing protein [Oscillospiraceae bacterium]